MTDELVEQHLGLARVIACEYANIPGATLDEITAEAETALAAAARAFDPAKGQFAAYAGRAIRNALNSLFTRQVRYVQVHELGHHQPGGAGQSGEMADDHRSESKDPSADVALEVRAAESRRVLEDVLVQLPPRSRLIVERVREGKSYAEIGAELGVSKQAANKVALAALQSLREKLEALGFAGMDSKGFLKSRSRGAAPG
jgi:RNA polymerase sigma factor (sigma-70 family)